jgi:hypothetical protein
MSWIGLSQRRRSSTAAGMVAEQHEQATGDEVRRRLVAETQEHRARREHVLLGERLDGEEPPDEDVARRGAAIGAKAPQVGGHLAEAALGEVSARGTPRSSAMTSVCNG